MLQIYNEKIYDLMQDRKREFPLQLRESSGGAGNANLTASNGTVYVRGLSVYRVYSKEEAFALLRKGLRNRAVRSTEFNSDSSRSHTILQLFVTIEEEDSGGLIVLKRSTLSLVDLAGSEKWRASLSQNSVANQLNSSGNVNLNQNSVSGMSNTTSEIREMSNINTSLHVLGNCVSALIEPGRKHIPYRDSLLTRLLQDSLGGNGKTVFIATIHHPQDLQGHQKDETLSTLQVALYMKNCVFIEDSIFSF